MLNFPRLFIRRPIGTTLMATALFLVGVLAYEYLPVASMPNMAFPTIYVTASRPGADPKTMAATVAAPIERRLGEISGINDLTSVSTAGSTFILAQFDLNRSVDAAARDVQAALNAALKDLPPDLPTLPTLHKASPGEPILVLALHSRNLERSMLYDVADSVIAQRLAQVAGVGDVTVASSDQPAIRVSIDPTRLASMGLAMEDVRTAIVNANAVGPVGSFKGTRREVTIGVNDQLRKARDFNPVVVRSTDGAVVRLSDVATIRSSVRNTNSDSWYNHDPSLLIFVSKRADANAIETVDRINSLLPKLKRWIPAGIDISVLVDRTKTIRASVRDMQLTLGASIFLVMLVVAAFLRSAAPTVAAGVTVPLSLAGTCAGMWAFGFSIDNLSLMALAICVGFVVDDAIVMIENMFRYLEKGASPLRASLKGAKQIRFTILTISISLLAAFMPVLFMGGVVGRLFREFSVTLAFAIAVSTVVSLSVTPMICAHFVRRPAIRDVSRIDRWAESVLSRTLRFYGRSLEVAIEHRTLVLVLFLASVALTFVLFLKVPKGYFPQDDTGLIFAGTDASPATSFAAMKALERKAIKVVLADPAVSSVGANIGDGLFGASNNGGRMFIDLRSPSERQNLSTKQVAARLHTKLDQIPGIRAWLVPMQDLHAGAYQGNSQYQVTLWSSHLDLLEKWVPRVLARMKKIPGLIDVRSDGAQRGLQAEVKIDRHEAAHLGVRMEDIDNALNDAFSQRQISTIYTERNQYHVILEANEKYQRDPVSLDQIYVTGDGGRQVPLSAVAHFVRTVAPLAVKHKGQFPAVTIAYGLAPNASIEDTTEYIEQAVAEMHMPDAIHVEFDGDITAFKNFTGIQWLLLLAALISVYIVLGVLYESFAHPLTIISTLPPAGLGALLALQISRCELTVIAFIGIILLIGIVKKNGILIVDFALDSERRRHLSPQRAIREACLERFRPILMTTLTAILGALPLIIASGPGAELRRPLGITIVGGLLVSQVLTLYTTPVIYLFIDKWHKMLGGMTHIFGRTSIPSVSTTMPSSPARQATARRKDYAEVDR